MDGAVDRDTMSTTHGTPTDRIEVLSDEASETVTFVADLERDSIVPPTEWITAHREDTVDVLAKR